MMGQPGDAGWSRTRKARELAQIDLILSAYPRLCDRVAMDLASPITSHSCHSRSGSSNCSANHLYAVTIDSSVG